MINLILLASLLNTPFSLAAVNQSPIVSFKEIANELQKQRHKKSERYKKQFSQKHLLRKKSRNKRSSQVYKRSTYTAIDKKPFFDIPVTYNQEVQNWIKYYQTTGRKWLKRRLERSSKYLPAMKQALASKGLPQDLAYISMIESGFSAHAVSTANAVGYWQFIAPTAERYNLKINWWIDERRDFIKSTYAAAGYLGDLYKMFGSWYLTASAYNMGEGRMRRLIRKYKTNNFWTLSSKRRFPDETKNYIPKLLAALLISKAPRLYGFKDIVPMKPYRYDYIFVPGGTDLYSLSQHIGVARSWLKTLNPDLKMGFIPGFVKSHRIRIPKGFQRKVAKFIKTQL